MTKKTILTITSVLLIVGLFIHPMETLYIIAGMLIGGNIINLHKYEYAKEKANSIN